MVKRPSCHRSRQITRNTSGKNLLSLTRTGLGDWLVQRVTAVIMAIYIFFLFSFFIFHNELQFFTWQALFTSTIIRIFSFLFLLSLLWHAWVGMWIVTTDYLSCSFLRLFAQIIIIIALITYVIWGVIILWSA